MKLLLATTVLGLSLAAVVHAEGTAASNVDLSTVPARQTVQLTIYNSEDLTLVRETRTVSFTKGVNALQFSWANTQIDPTSVRLRLLTHADKLDVLDTTFPHAKPQMLYWNVQSARDGAATVEITYFTSGIHWSADYVCTAQPDETQMGFEGFVRVANNSGEAYENAQVRLVVGKINLVETIARLATNQPQLRGEVLRKNATEEKLGEVVELDLLSVHHDDAKKGSDAKPKQIGKQGLSEYFIYTIEGTETVPNGWSKRMRSFEGQTVPVTVQYRYRLAEYGDRLVRMYLLTNDLASKLGTTPLPDGIVRVFRRNANDGLSFLAAQPIKYVPIGDKIELNLGPDPEVIFEWVKLRTWRDQFWLQLQGADVFRRADEAGAQIELNSSVVGWDEHTLYAQRVRNYSQKPIDLEIRRTLPGDIVFRSALGAKNHDYQTAQFSAAVPPRRKVDLLHEVVRHQGRNAKQNRVAVEDAAIEP